jgi:hypothetical protein
MDVPCGLIRSSTTRNLVHREGLIVRPLYFGENLTCIAGFNSKWRLYPFS